MPRGAPRPGAVVEVTDAEGNVTRLHSFTCCHHGLPVTVPEGVKVEEVSDICRTCWRLHCLAPACCGACVPFARRVEAAEARHESLRSMGLT